MSSILISISVIVGLILAVGLMSLSESALVTARRWRLRERAARGERGAAAALRLAEHLERFVPTVRVGATLAGTMAGVCAGLWMRESLGPATGDSLLRRAVTIGGVVAGITVATLVAGRALAAQDRTALAGADCLLDRPAHGGLCHAGGSSVAGLSNGRPSCWPGCWAFQSTARPPITQEEIKGLLREGTKAGVFEEAEYDIFRRVFLFCERRGRVLMTPRDEVVWIDVGDSPDEIRRKVIGSPHSRFPVCDQSLDNLLGIVQVKDLLAQNSGGPTFRIKGLLTLPAFIYEGTRGPQILEILKKSSTHTAVVLDEYGSVVGLLTLSDIRQRGAR